MAADGSATALSHAPSSCPPPSTPTVAAGRIVHAFSIQVLCRALGMLASIASVTMTARYLGPQAYGQLTIAVTFMTMWTSLADLGIGTVIVRRVTSGRGDLERLVRINGGLYVMYCLPLITVATGGGLLLYHDSAVRVMLVVLSVQLLMTMMTARFEPVFMATVNFSAVAVSDLIGRLATLAVVSYLLTIRADVIWFAVAQLVWPALLLVIQALAAAQHVTLRPVFSFADTADLLRESLPSMGVVVIAILYWRTDGVILSLVSTHAEVGVYGLAYTLAFNTMVLSMFFLKSTLSSATELFARDVTAFAAFMRRSVELMYFLAVPVAVIGVLLARPLIGLIGDQAFLGRGTPTLALLLVAVAVRFVTGTLTQGLFASRYQHFLFRLQIATLALNVMLNLVLDLRFGAVGAAAALVCTEVFCMAIASWWLHRTCGYSTPLPYLLKVLVPTAASAAVTLLLAGHHVVAILFAAAVTYLATNLVIGPATWSSWVSMRRRQIQK